MIRLRKSSERGHAEEGWLDSRHTFSFANYYDPNHMGFRTLRVINEDRVAPGGGFPLHPHRDMEILSVVLEGALEHGDSLGHREIIAAGAVQRITAGRGLQHSEANPSASETVHFLQIWIEPGAPGLTPGYEIVRPPRAVNGLTLLASPDGRGGSARIEQDALVFDGAFGSGVQLDYRLAPGRGAWVQVVSGELKLNGLELTAGDGAAVEEIATLELEAGAAGTRCLLFDLH
jgi:redox-sensitive bicupin YhaK (pirin superfamily)